MFKTGELCQAFDSLDLRVNFHFRMHCLLLGGVILVLFSVYNERLYYVLQLLKNHVEEPFFNELRTERQLAYYLTTRVANTRGVLGMYFILVSSSKDP